SRAGGTSSGTIARRIRRAAAPPSERSATSSHRALRTAHSIPRTLPLGPALLWSGMRRLYFGYGSNLDEADFHAYVGARGHHRAALRDGTPAILPDHAPAYRYRSDAREGGALDVRPHPGAATPGALFEVDEPTLRALDEKEGVSTRCYERVDVCVLDLDGNEHHAFTYRVCEERLVDFMPPLEGYVRVVSRGLERYGLPEAWHRKAAENQLARPLSVFVYGTLRQGEEAAHRLPGDGRLSVEAARARGRLLHLGEYP